MSYANAPKAQMSITSSYANDAPAAYEMVIEQVRTLPEQLLTSVSAFIKLLEMEQGASYIIKTAPKRKTAFLDLAGKIHLDRDSVTELRESSIL